jgi:hypothetical protein
MTTPPAQSRRPLKNEADAERRAPDSELARSMTAELAGSLLAAGSDVRLRFQKRTHTQLLRRFQLFATPNTAGLSLARFPVPLFHSPKCPACSTRESVLD